MCKIHVKKLNLDNENDLDETFSEMNPNECSKLMSLKNG